MLGTFFDAVVWMFVTLLDCLWSIDSHIIAILVAMVMTLTFNGIYLNGENLFYEMLRITITGVFVWKWMIILANMVYGPVKVKAPRDDYYPYPPPVPPT